MAKDKAPLSEREKPFTPELDDLKNISAAFIGLLEDDEVSTEVDAETNTKRFSIARWLEERGVEGEILREDPTLSVPEFYFTPEQVQRITGLADIDDFPVLEPDDIIFKDEDTGLEVYHHRWQQAFLLLSVRSRGFGTRVMHLFVQPGRSKWAYSTNKRISTHTSAWDARGSYSPDMTRDTQTVMDALAKYGEELRTRHLH